MEDTLRFSERRPAEAPRFVQRRHVGLIYTWADIAFLALFLPTGDRRRSRS